MRQHHERIVPAGLVIGGKGHDALQRNAFLAGPVDGLHLAERDLCQLVVAFVRQSLKRLAVGDGDIRSVLRIAHGERQNVGAEAICGDTGPSQNGPIGPGVGRHESVVLKGIHFNLDTARHRYPDVSGSIAGKVNGAGLEFGGAIHRLSTGSGDRPDMVGSQDLGGGAEERQILAAVDKRDIAAGVVDGSHVAGARCTADVDGGVDVVKADLRRLRQDGQRGSVARPGDAFGCDIPQCGTPPGAAGTIGIDHVEAGGLSFDHSVYIFQRIGQARIGQQRIARPIRRDQRRNECLWAGR